MAQGQAVSAVIHIYGVVQGVGFRPFVARLAAEHRIGGTVRNARGHVVIEAIALSDDLSRFIQDIEARKPAGSQISRMTHHAEPLPAERLTDLFVIVPSDEHGDGPVMPTPDLTVCDDCLREMRDADDPRHRNLFISCTNCGPRFSIMRRVPYDRVHTAMDVFPLCPLCGAQYGDQTDRRYHAQTVCCNACGPTLAYRDHKGEAVAEDALERTVAVLLRGGIAAVKGIGGYHLACSPSGGEAVARLRALKGREHKPFAVLFADMQSLRTYCEATAEEEALLLSAARPIVLLARKASPIHPAVYTTSPRLGAFLAYTPLQHLLLEKTGPLVMTSANVSSLPLIKEDTEMLAFLAANETLDCVLYHNRPILRRLDDSVAMVALGKPAMLRRARGYAPMGIPLSLEGPALLACGAQEKSSVCLYQDGYAALSAEIGDLDSDQAVALYRHTIPDMQDMLCIKPSLAVCDMHPGYASTQYALDSGLPVVQVQHHHAHIASVMAEHGLTGPVIGVAFDGTGYGTDGTVWGGEFLIATPSDFLRAGHLKPVAMLGGDDSVRQGWKSAACLLHDAGIDGSGDPRTALVRAALAHGVNTIFSSSMGRVFDAVSAMLGICQVSQYGGQCAIELENAAARCAQSVAEVEPFSYDLLGMDGRINVDLSPCIRALHSLYQEGTAPDELALRFHSTVSHVIAAVCKRLSQEHGIRAVALSGGVFANRLLLSQTIPLLEQAGLSVYRNQQVPAGDGGIALGQAYTALSRRNFHVHCDSGESD